MSSIQTGAERFFFSSRRRHTSSLRDWSSDVCSSDLSEPLASETVGGIVSLIAELVEGGHAYESGGDVYFRVRSFDQRSEERRVGKECRSRWSREYDKRNIPSWLHRWSCWLSTYLLT